MMKRLKKIIVMNYWTFNLFNNNMTQQKGIVQVHYQPLILTYLRSHISIHSYPQIHSHQQQQHPSCLSLWSEVHHPTIHCIKGMWGTRRNPSFFLILLLVWSTTNLQLVKCSILLQILHRMRRRRRRKRMMGGVTESFLVLLSPPTNPLHLTTPPPQQQLLLQIQHLLRIV